MRMSLVSALGMSAWLLAAALASAAPAPGPGAATSSHFRDCPDCPQMVVIPAGKFTMGSSADEKTWAASHGAVPDAVVDEAPQHAVSLQAFALGERDVTRGEYAAFVHATGHASGDGCGKVTFSPDKLRDLDWQHTGFLQTDSDPVVCVSWQDAQAYVLWLNRKLNPKVASGDGVYRLPSEAEWEYAARAGTTTKFWWGDDVAGADSHAWYRGNAVSGIGSMGDQPGKPFWLEGLAPYDHSKGGTHPTGSKPANAFGLYDMAGNVWQWTEDCYADSYAAAPVDGGAVEGRGTCMRVDRGSSWFYPAWLLRSATRERNPPDFRSTLLGFRVAKSLR
jgi:formylglycine-generating enzyme required for sulfatase activity